MPRGETLPIMDFLSPNKRDFSFPTFVVYGKDESEKKARYLH
jgi:hypothetical protein